MEVIVLAGGLGTRLRSVLNDIPKPMALVKNKPFLEYVLTWLSEYNINKIVLSAGYRYEIIENYFKNVFKDIPIEYAIEPEPLGTGGGILHSLPYICDESALVVNGDTYFPIDLDAFFLAHLAMKGEITIALKEMIDFDRYGSVSTDQNYNIIQFQEKKFQKQGLINGGIYLLKRKFIYEHSLPGKFSFEKEILEKEINNKSIKGIPFNTQFLDIGVPEDYYKAEQLL